MPSYLASARAILASVRGHPLTDGLYLAGTYTRVSQPPYDPATGDTGTAPATAVPVRLRKEGFGLAEVDGDRILHTDCKLSVLQSEVPEAPEADDTVTLAGAAWAVVRVLEEAPGLTWTLHARSLAP